MADEDQATAPAGDKPAPSIAIKAQYLRDLSFENVSVQQSDGRMDDKPEIQVGVNLDAKKRGEDSYEVILKITATAKGEETVMFLVELEYAGMFEIKNVPQNQLHPVLMIECPRIIFPFARRIISDVTRDGGYPPLMLDMVDFAGIYRAELEKRRAAGNLETETPAGTA